MKQRRDIQAEITAKVIALIEEHGANWTKPFSELSGAPINAVTGKKYRGVNALFLGLLGVQYAAGYNQWQTIGAQVRGGEKAIRITAPIPIKDKETGETSFMKWSSANVWSADQVDGFEAPRIDAVDETEVIEGVDAFVANTGADIRSAAAGGCFFSPAQNFIQILHREQFTATGTSTATECFYSTLLHELVHWTGHKSRLDRLDTKNREGYAFEELVAEMGSALLCVELGVSAEPRADHATYIASWLKALKDDKAFIFKAAKHAQAAADLLFAIQAEQEVAA